VHKTTSCLLAGSLLLASCAGPNGQVSDQTQTVAEGAGIGVLVGAGLGALVGGSRGALIGAAIGGGAGLLAGGYVARQKEKYATIEQRIAGERQIVQQATATARSQTAASASRLQLVNAQLAELGRMQGDQARAQQTANTMLISLQKERGTLEASKKELQTRLKDQQAFITETEGEIGDHDPQKMAQLQQWKADMPALQDAITAMTNQISEISAMETRVQSVKVSCC
jgi:chromosome segregation ATPase